MAGKFELKKSAIGNFMFNLQAANNQVPNGTTPPHPPRQSLLESRLAYHHRCLREDATDPKLPALERLALERDREARVQAVRWSLIVARQVPKHDSFFPRTQGLRHEGIGGTRHKRP